MSAGLRGRPAAPGVAVAPAFRVASPGTEPPSAPGSAGTARGEEAAKPPTEGGERKAQQARLEAALARAEANLEEIAEDVAERVGPEEAAIFEAHAAFAADPELAAAATEAIKAGASAEAAARQAFDRFRDLLAASDNEYLSARATDLDDVRDRVIALLRGVDPDIAVPEERSVVVTTELTPSQTALLPHELIAGIATASGSPTSHAAILARALGIPAVVGVGSQLDTVAAGAMLAIDGASGELLVAPDRDEQAAFAARAQRDARRRAGLDALRDIGGQTADGRRVELAANVADIALLDAAREAGAQGSGLVRTELLFLDRHDAPSVDEQAGFYRRTLEAFPGQRVVFRTMDIGADKPLPFVDRGAEPNPALGLRGIRLSLAEPDLLRDQLRALLRAHAQTNRSARLGIMFPLVSEPRELAAARGILEDVAAEEDIGLEQVEVGVMVEVPSAALAARRLARQADFLSIGTNDLLQYLFAADRLAGDVADLPDLFDPDVLRLVADVIEAGHAEGAWVGVCGEAAADPITAAALVGLGIDELSMSPAAIPEVKDALRHQGTDTLAAAARAAMTAADGTDARRRVTEALT